MLNGGGGRDDIKGGGGHDTIDGGKGGDYLSGGAMTDTFAFSGDFGHDTVSGFSANNHEDIDLSGVSAITGFHDLITHHLTTDDNSGFAMITDGTSNTILLVGFTVGRFRRRPPHLGGRFHLRLNRMWHGSPATLMPMMSASTPAEGRSLSPKNLAAVPRPDRDAERRGADNWIRKGGLATVPQFRRLSGAVQILQGVFHAVDR